MRYTSTLLQIVLLLGTTGLAHAQVAAEESAAELELTELLKVRAVTGARHDPRLPRQISAALPAASRHRLAGSALGAP